jgi:hypothetical protein
MGLCNKRHEAAEVGVGFEESVELLVRMFRKNAAFVRNRALVHYIQIEAQFVLRKDQAACLGVECLAGPGDRSDVLEIIVVSVSSLECRNAGSLAVVFPHKVEADV